MNILQHWGEKYTIGTHSMHKMNIYLPIYQMHNVDFVNNNILEKSGNLKRIETRSLAFFWLLFLTCSQIIIVIIIIGGKKIHPIIYLFIYFLRHYLPRIVELAGTSYFHQQNLIGNLKLDTLKSMYMSRWKPLLVWLFLFRLKVPSQNIKLDIYINGELLSPYDDKKFIGEVQLKDRSVFLFSLFIFLYCLFIILFNGFY